MPPTSQEFVSVVMPVHNALPHLDQAIQSILDQTYSHFEFVILDDASDDGSTERLRDWAQRDPRIRLFEGTSNLGPALSSNWVVEKAAGRIIARMDADDVSHPDRLARQLELFRKQPDVGLVGTLCDIIDAKGGKLRSPELWRLSRKSWFAPFPHGSIMFRREVFERVGGYRRECEYWEDQDIVLRISGATNILVIPAALYQHRQSTTSTRIASDRERVERAVDLMYRSMDRLDQNRGYDDLLGPSGERSDRVDPRVFISLGSLVLWAGDKPRLFRRLLRRGRLGIDGRTLSALVWTGWASLSPSLLRAFLSLVVRVRTAVAAAGSSRNLPVRWSPATRHLLLATAEANG